MAFSAMEILDQTMTDMQDSFVQSGQLSQQSRVINKHGTARITSGKKPKTVSKAIHPWSKIEAVYVEGLPETHKDGRTILNYPSHQAVADLFAISVATVRQRAAREQWTTRREQHQAQLAAQRRQERHRELAQYASDIDEKAVHLSRTGLSIVQARILELAEKAKDREIWKEDKQLCEASGTRFIRPEPKPVDARELDQLAAAATKWHALGRQGLGDDVTKLQITGPDGGPVQTIHAHMVKEDPERLSKVLDALKRSNVLTALMGMEEPIEAELVDEIPYTAAIEVIPDPYEHMTQENGYDIQSADAGVGRGEDQGVGRGDVILETPSDQPRAIKHVIPPIDPNPLGLSPQNQAERDVGVDTGVRRVTPTRRTRKTRE